MALIMLNHGQGVVLTLQLTRTRLIQCSCVDLHDTHGDGTIIFKLSLVLWILVSQPCLHSMPITS